MRADKKLNPNWKKRISEIGKNNFELEEMIRLGFFEINKSSQAKLDDLAKQQNSILSSISNSEKEVTTLQSEIKEAQDTEKLLTEIRKKRIQKSLSKRLERKIKKRENKRVDSALMKQKRLRIPPFLGRGVSGKLQYENECEDKLELKNLPVLRDLQDLSDKLDLKLGDISWLSYHREVSTVDHYKRFKVLKRNGKDRLISAPKPKLKLVQTWINQVILNNIEPENEAMAFRPRKNILDNARLHSNQGTIIRMDLKDFFPSIKFPRVRGLFHSMGYSSGISSVLALLCTDSEKKEIEFESKKQYVSVGPRVLPQGASTSPAISNLLASQLDKRIRGYLKFIDSKWSYTRYADDLVLSHPKKNIEVGRLLAYLDKVIHDEGFAINQTKTTIMRSPHRQMVTGLVMSKNGPRIQKKYLRNVRAMLHNAEKEISHGQAILNIDEIKGKLAFIKMIMPSYFIKLTQNHEWLYR
jgi:RNA-directed DNA polymerase